MYQSSIERYSVDNAVKIHEAHTLEDFTGIDETLPQHYGFPSTKLDWTRNPYVAIYFALGSIEEDLTMLDNGIYIASSDLPDNVPYFSVYAYKQIATDDSPVITTYKPSYIPNLRAEKQEGIFTEFKKPCSFYIIRGKFPSIEEYCENVQDSCNKRQFDLIKYSVPRNDNNILFLKGLLREKGINRSYLAL